MAEHRKELEKKTKPILDTLRSYQDLPPDKALAALAIEDKKRQYAIAEKYLEDVLQSALSTTEYFQSSSLLLTECRRVKNMTNFCFCNPRKKHDENFYF
ncbi:unnamed protein product [Camellia sinensis]